MNFYEQQAYNRRKTWIVVLMFVLFYLLVGLSIDVVLLGFPGDAFGVSAPAASQPWHEYEAPVKNTGATVPVVTLIMGLVTLLLLIRAFSVGAIEVIKSAKGYHPDENNPKHKMFLNVLEEMSIASGVPMPRAVIVPDPSPNAFATGLNTEKSFVAVTEGLLETLNRDELQGVVAHEMGHVKNLDVRLMTIVSAFAGALVLISILVSDLILRGGLGSGRSRGSGNRNSGAGIIIIILFAVALRLLVPLMSSLMSMAVSRKREYLADATAAEFTRNPRALASALAKISGRAKKSKVLNDAVAHMCIAEIEHVRLSQKKGFWADMFSTHPPVADRIAALEAMSYKYE